MIAAKIKVTALATVTGMLPVSNPNESQSKVPIVNSQYMDKEKPEVSLVRMVFIAWGIKEAVVHIAPPKPISVIQSMFIKSMLLILVIVNAALFLLSLPVRSGGPSPREEGRVVQIFNNYLFYHISYYSLFSNKSRARPDNTSNFQACLNPSLGRVWGGLLKPSHNLNINQPWCKPVGNTVHSIGKVFY